MRAPSSDVATLKRDPKLSVATIDTVYVFNMEIDMRDTSPQVSAKDGSALAKNPLQDPRVREAIDLAIDRPALVEIAMEGLGAPVNQLVTSSIAGFNKSLPPLKVDIARAKKLLEEAGYPNGFKTTFSFTNDRLPGDRQVGTSVAQMLARIGLDVTANAQTAAVFFPARTRAEYSLAMSGWGTLTGEANYTLSSVVHSNDPAKKLGAFNVLGYKNPALDKLIEDAAVELDEAKRNDLLSQANAIVAKDRPRLPIVAVGSAWAMQKDKVTIAPRVDEDTLAMDIKPRQEVTSSFSLPGRRWQREALTDEGSHALPRFLPSSVCFADTFSPQGEKDSDVEVLPHDHRPRHPWRLRHVAEIRNERGGMGGSPGRSRGLAAGRLGHPQPGRQCRRRRRGGGAGDGGFAAFQRRLWRGLQCRGRA